MCEIFYSFSFPFVVVNMRILTVRSFGCLVDALLIMGVPDGPTAHFKLSKLVLRKDIKVCC